MVTLIPVAFGAGKWVANVPTGYLLDHLGRQPLTIAGLLVIAACDVTSIAVADYGAFLAARACAGIGWAMFATVATTAMVNRAGRRGRSVSSLLMAESLGLLIGNAIGGSLYVQGSAASPFVAEAGCMVIAATVVARFGLPGTRPRAAAATPPGGALRDFTHVRGFVLMCCTSAALMAIQTGVLVFLFPLYLVERGSLSPQATGQVIALSVLGRLLALSFAGRMSDRRSQISMLALGLSGCAIVLGSVALVRGAALLAVWSVLLGVATGFVAALPTTIIGDRVDASRHGIAVGWLRTVSDVGMLAGPLMMGPLADAVGLDGPFLLAAVIACAFALACYRDAGRTR
jgi:MFS family permease